MKTFCAVATRAVSLMGSLGSTYSQPYSGPGSGSGYGRDYERYGPGSGSGYGRDYEPRGPRYGRVGGFDEGEYLRCNPDVRRAVRRGEQPSGWVHYQRFGRYENRPLRC
jgi:hypothetical protein